MARAGFLKGIANNPMQTIEVILAGCLAVTGLWLVSPFFTPQASTSAKLSQSVGFAFAMGVIEILLAVPFIISLSFGRRWPMGIKVRRFVTFGCFLLFTFYAAAGASLHHLHRINWVSSLGFALIAGVCHIRLKWEVITRA